MENKKEQTYDDVWEEMDKKDNDFLYNSVKPLLSEKKFKDILQLLEDSDWTYSYSIEDKPKGEYQDESDDYPEIKGYWANQTTNGGYDGDDFKGTVSVELINDRYFHFHYCM